MDDQDLVSRLRAGDSEAFDQIYARYAETAARTAYLITHSHAAAEDVAHDAFMEVLKSISGLREPAHFRAWFYRIVVNKAKRHMRRRSVSFIPLDRATCEHADVTALSPDELLLRAEEVALLWDEIAKLNDMYRLPMIFRYYTRLGDAEIANILTVPVGTVKSRLSYARKLLHERLHARGYGHSPGRTRTGRENGQDA